jgi:hypothetical protein
MGRTVLILEDDVARLHRFKAAIASLKPAADVVAWRDASQMISELERHLPSACLISLDHDLYPTAGESHDPGDGLDVARYLAKLPPVAWVIVHSSNVDRSFMMLGELDLGGWRCIRVAPIGEDWIESDWLSVVRQRIAPNAIT